jgi:hypothetical protein
VVAILQEEQEKRDREMKRKMEARPPQKGDQDGKSDKKGASKRGGGGRMPSIDPAIYGFAPVDGAFIVRAGKELFCIGTPAN